MAGKVKKVARSFRTGNRYRVVKVWEGSTAEYGDAERVFFVEFDRSLHGGDDSFEAASKAEKLAKAIVCEDFDIPEDRRSELRAIAGRPFRVTVVLG